ncbi:MAG: CehA/McbA family metallohydrolase [Clostridia bacterium]|nr:CehA/McbA family metallohydrolase [Clostridia bacterium]
MKLFREEGAWRKGNLHTHTTISDGQRSVEESAALYKAAGYEFLAITDHHKNYMGGEMDGLLLLAGVELHNNGFSPIRRCYHITGIGIQQPVEIPSNSPPQDLVNALRDAGAFVTLAHPAWSLMTYEEVDALEGYDAIEIWNGVSGVYSGRGDSSAYIDVLAARGKLVPFTAVDDTHYYKKDQFSGFVRVKTTECTQDAIIEALRSGQFYSSQGPEIHQITIDDETNVVSVETSPLQSVIFYTDSFYAPGRVVEAEEGGAVTQASYTPTRWDHVVRVEGIDHEGKRVWSNYIKLNRE